MEFTLAYSTVEDGNMSVEWGDKNPDTIAKNRKDFLAKNALAPDSCTYLNLEHGANIAVVGEADKGKSFKADALITNAPGVGLFLMTADCLPLSYHDPVKQVIALAHLGWKSSDLGLAGKVVERMMREFASNPGDIEVVIGPGIRKESYLVKEPSQKSDLRWTPFMDEAMGFMRIDLVGFNLKSLADAGVLDSRVSVSPENTAVSSQYFSHRRSMQTKELEGRFATVAALTAA